jgi:molybdenum-dependent DNA-binding transcriptional regulator ModE
VVADEIANAGSFHEGFPQMTSQRRQIFRAFTRGESIARIAESSGVNYRRTWSYLRRAVAELDRKNPSALDTVRWQNYLMLMRVVDQAFAAFEKSADDGVSEVASQTIESADDCVKLGLTGRSITRRGRKDAGDPRLLEVAMKALREIRDLFGIGAEAESKLRAASPEGGLALEALLRTGAARLTTRWAKPVESGTQPRRPLE